MELLEEELDPDFAVLALEADDELLVVPEDEADEEEALVPDDEVELEDEDDPDRFC